MNSNTFKIIVLVLFVIAAGTIVVLKNKKRSTIEAPGRTTTLPTLLELGSHSCVPCKMMMPILDTLREVHKGKLQVEFIDVRENREAGEKYKIRSIPTQIIFDASGTELFRHEGFWSREDMEMKMGELGISLGEDS